MLRGWNFRSISAAVPIGLVIHHYTSVQQDRQALPTLESVSCQNNLHQIGLAFGNFESSHGSLPPAFMDVRSLVNVTYEGIGIDITWQDLILPYIEQDALWQQTLDAYKIDLSAIDNPPHIGLTAILRTYACPSDGRIFTPITDDEGFTAAYGSYQGVSGGAEVWDGVMQGYRGTRYADITDGSSQTLAAISHQRTGAMVP